MNSAIATTSEAERNSGNMCYQLESVWPTPPDDVREEVVDFWLAESAIPDRQLADQRAYQLLVVARDALGQVAGVSTAVPTFIPQLGFECFYYRTFVGHAHRARGLRSSQIVWRILRQSYAVLNERFQQGLDRQVLGCYAEIESQSIARSQQRLVLNGHGVDAVYFGRTHDGRQIRVLYFDGAELP